MNQEHIILTIRELALSDPSQKDKISKLQIADNDQVIVDIQDKDELFTSEMILVPELAQSPLLIYLFD
jgi:hypothetical protein